MKHSINPSKRVKIAAKKARKDEEFKEDILNADPDCSVFFGWFITDLNKVLLATMYGGWILAKRGKIDYNELQSTVRNTRR